MSPAFQNLEKHFSKKENLAKALTHKSYANELKLKSEHNEKFEFLGDAVLDLVVGELLYEKYPLDSEGGLSKKRASIVNEEVLSEIAKKLQIHEFLLLGRGETLTGGAQKPRLLASAFEAIIGGMFLDQGFIKTREFIRSHFVDVLGQLTDLDYEKDYKTRLQELVQKSNKETPTYELISEEGPPHDRLFRACVKVLQQILAEGVGRSKKMAEQAAAHEAIKLHFKEKV